MEYWLHPIQIVFFSSVILFCEFFFFPLLHYSNTPACFLMTEYTERFYRNRVKSEDLVSFEVRVKETDLLVSAEQNLEKETRDLVFDSRH